MKPEIEDLANFRTWAVGTGRYSLTTAARMERTVRSLYQPLKLWKPDTKRLWQYVELQLKKGRRGGTTNNQMMDISAWFRFKGIDLKVPVLRNRRRKEPWVPSDEEVFRVIGVSDRGSRREISLRNKVVLEIMAFCGLRVGELFQLNLTDVQGDYLHVRSEKLEAERLVGIPKFLRADIASYLRQRKRKENTALFISRGGRFSYSAVRKMVKRMGIRAGIKDMHPHALRHWCATRLVRSGVNLRSVQIHLGHASIATTQLYTHLSSVDAAMEVNRAFEQLYSSDQTVKAGFSS